MNLILKSKYLPGTVIENDGSVSGEVFLNNIFYFSDGVMLSRIKEVSGLDGSTLQNWVKRGWIGNTVNKKYSKNQFARILIINMLRGALQLEHIDRLLKFVNGTINCEDDDIIPESRLYAYICDILKRLEAFESVGEKELVSAVNESVSDYNENIEGATVRLKKALVIIITAYCASLVTGNANSLLKHCVGER